MRRTIKIGCSVLVVALVFALTVTLTKSRVVEAADAEWAYAYQSAIEDAGTLIRGLGYTTGSDDEMEGFAADAQKAASRFLLSLHSNLGAAVPEIAADDVYIPLYGYIGERYISAVYSDGGVAAAYPYTYLKEYRVYNFTLDDTVYVTDAATGNEVQTSLSDFEEHFFSASLTNEEFRAKTVSDAIATYLSLCFDDGMDIALLKTDADMGFDDNLTTLDAAPDFIQKTGFFVVVECNSEDSGDKIRILVADCTDDATIEED